MDTPQTTVSTQIIPYLFYDDVAAALDWLTRAFGFTEELRHAKNGGMHAQMTLDGQRIMMGQGSTEWRMVSANRAQTATQGIFGLSRRCGRAPRTSAGCGRRDRPSAA